MKTGAPHHADTAFLTPKYRTDIDGLRAAAILSVILYHAFPAIIPGGFTGVDIFFVISGYLISSIIFSNLERGHFSFIEFYSRRIRRIFPALLLVLACTFVFGWFFLFADEYNKLGGYIRGGAGFFANFVKKHENGYFDQLSNTKPLLHLWSLGIEEQFYIIWPLLIYAAWRLRLNWLVMTIGIAIVSFALNVRGVAYDAGITFYMPQTRFWELLMGGTLANIKSVPKQQKYGNAFSLAGSLLLLGGLFIITPDRQFPGYWALLPTLGAALLIYGGSKAWINRTLLSHPAMVWIGLISYPLYLWHWPPLAFLHIAYGDSLPAALTLAALLAAFALAWLTYQFVEKPLRFGDNLKEKTQLLFCLMVAVGCVGQLTMMKHGFDFRFKEKEAFIKYFDNTAPDFKFMNRAITEAKYKTNCDFYDIGRYVHGKSTNIPKQSIDPTCYTRDSRKTHAVFLWGDSHAQQLNYGLMKNLPPSWQVLRIASSGCDPNLETSADPTQDFCETSNRFALKEIADMHPDVVIIAQNKGHSLEKAQSLNARLKAMGINGIIFVGPVVHWKSFLPKIIARHLWPTAAERTFVGVDMSFIEENTLMKTEFSANHLHYADLISQFCNTDGCLTRLSDDIKTSITTVDYGHLTPPSSDYVAKKLLIPMIMETSKQTGRNDK